MDRGVAGQDRARSPAASQSSSAASSSPGSDNADSADARSRAKALVISNACQRRDVDHLRRLAVSAGGFLSDVIRRQAWPILLGYTPPRYDASVDEKHAASGLAPADSGHTGTTPIGAHRDANTWRQLCRHRDEDQVKLDVDRSFIYYPHNQSETQLELKKAELSDLITEVLRRQPYLSYFQGYHDICQVFLLVLPPPERAMAVSRLSCLRIRDFMLPNLDPAIAQLRLIPDILLAADAKLCRHLSQTQPFFALSGTLTMYAHDVQEYGDIARLFDALLAREPVFSVYMFAQIVLNRREELFETPADEPEMLHSILSKLPGPLDLDALVNATVELFDSHPPESLRSWRSISGASVLKTARGPDWWNQSLDEGRRYFKRQVKELEWAERRRKIRQAAWLYRRQGVLLAVLVGVTAVYLRRTPPSGGFWGSFVAPLRWPWSLF